MDYADAPPPPHITFPSNPYYPDATEEDFEYYYDADASDIPWQTFANCSVCCRISQKINPSYAKEVGLYDPYRQKRIWHLVCSPQCEAIKRATPE